jgi:hypothetical protein
MEEMVHRERLRSWKRLQVEILNLAAQVTKKPEMIDMVTENLSEYYNMVVHNSNAYDLSGRVSGNSRYSSSGSSSDSSSTAEMLKKLEEIPDV